MSENTARVNTQLMREMGSTTGQFDPIPPAQYEALLDVDEGEDLRVWAALLQRTIGLANDQTRSAFARERNGQPTRNQHLVAALGMLKSHVSEALARLEAAGKIRIAEGRIWLCANVPAPNLEAKKQRKVPCTGNFTSLELRFLAQLHDQNPIQFRSALARVLAAEKWGDRVKADAIAWARERTAERRLQVFTEQGYTNQESRGAKRKRPSTASDVFQVPVPFEDFTVQNSVEIEALAAQFSVQNGKLILHGMETNGVQQAHPYVRESESRESASSQGRLDAKTQAKQAEREAGEANKTLKTELKNELNARLRAAGLRRLGAVAIDAQTQNTIAAQLAGLPHAGAVRAVLDVLEERARDIVAGRRHAKSWGYLVSIVKDECAERSTPGKDLKAHVAAAAAGKGMR